MSIGKSIALLVITAAVFSASASHAKVGPPPGWHAYPPVIAVPFQPSTSISPMITSAPFSPANVDGAYGITGLPLPNPTGAGVTIAIVDAYGDRDAGLVDHIQADLQQFSSTFGLPYTASGDGATLTEATPSGAPTSSDAGWALETALDVEWGHAVAPAAKILLVIAPDSSDGLYSCVDYAAAHSPIVSMSWGGGEWPDETYVDGSYFSAPGVAYFASTGDSGFGTSYPSVSPNVTAVGGTSLSIGVGNSYNSESGWSGSGGGTSGYEGHAAFQNPWVSSGNRQVPDIAAIADPNTGVYVYQNGGWYQVGGTSLACPVWAAIVGLMDANLSTPIDETHLQSLLYSFGANASLGTYFHDVTSGSNGVSAVAGYDQVTGIGTPKVGILLPAAVPLAPTSVSASASNAQATITWTASTLATSYNLYRGTTSGGEAATPIKTGLTGTQVTDTGLTNGQTYYYKLAAVTPYCTSLLSTETSATPTQTASSASFTGTNVTAHGSWKGVLGADGWNVLGDTSGNNPTYPAGVTVTAGAHSSGVWAASSIASNALSKSAIGAVDRVAGIWYQSTWSMTINTTSTRTISLYLLDYNNSGYAETITLRDEHGNLLDTESASGFQNGVYYNWSISGHVTFTFTSTAGHWAVLSGIFFDNAVTGHSVPGAPSNLTAQVGGRSIALSWTAASGATSYNVYRGTAAGGESMTPIATGIAGTTYTNSNLTPGVRYYYKVVGVNAFGGSSSSEEASALAVAAVATFVGVDTTTKGGWKGHYGVDGWNVFQDSSSNNPTYPSYLTVTPGAHSAGLWASTSTAANCLQKSAVGSTTRMAGVWYQTTWSMNLTVSGTHKVALYLLDYPNNGYAETITINNDSGGVLDTRSASGFAGGVYYVWNVSGNVTVTLTSTAGHWAVLSGLFAG